MTDPLYDRDGITLQATEWLNCYDDSWKGLITDESFSHPAKMARGLLVRIFDHAFQHGYLKRGDTVVDPFAARAARMTPEERTESARQAALARWRDVPKATHGDPDHPLRIGDIEIPCYVLEDGTRVITHRGLQGSLNMPISGGARETVDFLAKFDVSDLPSKDLIARVSQPIEFRPPIGGRTAFGYEATVLADICDLILAARKKRKLNARGLRIADRCEILVRGFARVGIIALVDEATGYQYDRARKALEEILEKFITDELGKWAAGDAARHHAGDGGGGHKPAVGLRGFV